MTIVAPVMVDAQRDAWLGLPEVAATLSAGWCLVGGQMVYLHCWERGFEPNRPTNDGDAVLDVRGHPSILREFTGTLTAIGFTPPVRIRVDTSIGGCEARRPSTC